MKNWWIGCSGFHYKGWREKFYPKDLPQRKWFEYYCEHFNTVELNSTFYRFPRLKDLQSFYYGSPDQFKFTVKAPRLITHFKKFHNARSQAMDFYGTVADGLQSKLGSVLFQLHPATSYSIENLERILQTVDPSFVNVVEFRHPSWWRKDVYQVLKENSISFCSISYPHLPDEVLKTSPVVYYRFHGVPKLYLSSYSTVKLRLVGHALQKLRQVQDVYCYFNNDIEVAAVKNAKEFSSIVVKDTPQKMRTSIR
jgi:uncharacterized protein YecE (DUF72 family)